MNIQQILNESTWGSLPKEIAKKIFNMVYGKIKIGKKFSVEITDLFKNINNNNIPIFFHYRKGNGRGSNAEVLHNDINYTIMFYRNYLVDASEGYDEETISDSYYDTIEHEVIHVLDTLRAKGKIRTANLRKEYGSNSRWNELATSSENPKESIKAYYKNVNEFNRLINQVVEFFKSNKNAIEKKIKNKQDLMKFLKIWEGEETSEAFNEDDKLYKSLIVRLNREGVLPKGFK